MGGSDENTNVSVLLSLNFRLSWVNHLEALFITFFDFIIKSTIFYSKQLWFYYPHRPRIRQDGDSEKINYK